MNMLLNLCIFLICTFGGQASDAAVMNCSSNARCRCTNLPDSSIKLDCSGLQLDKCPHIYGNVSFVDLSMNRISVFDEGLISSSVIHLDLAHNLVKTTDFISWKNLSKLETLNISYNKIKFLNTSSFSYGTNIRRLDISNCNLRYVMRGTFRPLTQLSHLNISFNKYLTFRVLQNITHDLQFTKIDVLDISRLHCTFGPGIVIQQEDFLYLNNTNLTSLHINSNRISEIERHTLQFLPPTLEKVYIMDNQFSMGQYVVELFALQGLTLFDGSFQYTIHTPTTATNQYRSCHDWRPPRPSSFLIEPQESKLEQPIGHFSSNGLSKVDIPLPLPPLLETSLFIGCGVKINIPAMHFTSQNSVKRIELRDNTFHSWEGPIYNLHQLEYLDLSNNFCSYISEVFFSDVPNLISLNISNNLLGFVLHKTNPFDYLYNLQTIELSSNRIDILKNDIFSRTTNLTSLTLRSNIMKTWDFSIQRTKKLRYIDLANNNIQSINENIREEITLAASTRTLKINLENNQMRCECSSSFLKQLKWMRTLHKTYGIFIAFDTYTCFSATGKLRYIHFSNDKEVRDFVLHCEHYVGMIMGVLAAIVLCIAILICGLVYRFRWKLRYLFYMKKNKYLRHEKRSREGKTYEFDAFVSYAEEDTMFIRKLFLEELETKRNFRLCLHQRDFIAGKDVADNITDAIHISRVTIAVITPSYLKSYWCMFEFNMARMESVYARDGENTIFLILYKPVPTNSLPLHMLDLINNKTYIEYPEDDIEGNVVFWDGVARGMSL